jgi:hypothetical protein
MTINVTARFVPKLSSLTVKILALRYRNFVTKWSCEVFILTQDQIPRKLQTYQITLFWNWRSVAKQLLQFTRCSMTLRRRLIYSWYNIQTLIANELRRISSNELAFQSLKQATLGWWQGVETFQIPKQQILVIRIYTYIYIYDNFIWVLIL